MILKLVFLTYLFNIFVSLVIGILLLVIRTSPRLMASKYRRSKAYLAIATLLVGAGNTTILLFGMENEKVDFFSLPMLVVSALQACLFTFLALTLFNSPRVNGRNTFKHLSPTLLFLLVYAAIVSVRPDINVYSVDALRANLYNRALLLRVLYALTYIAQLVIYTRLFLRERKSFIEKINDYFADPFGLRLRLGTNLFFQALLVGVAVLLFCFYPGPVQDIFLTLAITIFYFHFAVSYINYQYTLLQVFPAITEAATDPSRKEELFTTRDDLKDRLSDFLRQEPIYLKQGVVIGDLAVNMNIPKRILSSYINTDIGKNFNTWINSMRIEHAKKLISSSPGLTLQEIAEQSGFADNAMMSRVFKNLTGRLPSSYRDKPQLRGQATPPPGKSVISKRHRYYCDADRPNTSD